MLDVRLFATQTQKSVSKYGSNSNSDSNAN